MSEEQRFEKPGLSTGAKVAIGLGVAALLLIGTCVGGVVYLGSHAKEFAQKGNELVKSSMTQEWNELRTSTEQWMTDAGAKAWYAAHPGIQGNYPTETAFLEAAHAWRSRLEPVPETMPDLQSGQVSFQISTKNGARNSQLGYRNGRSARIELRWENGQIVDISVR